MRRFATRRCFAAYANSQRIDVNKRRVNATGLQHTLFPPTLAGCRRTVRIRIEPDQGLALHFAYHSPHLSADPELGDAHRTAFQAAYEHADADQVDRLLAWVRQPRGGA